MIELTSENFEQTIRDNKTVMVEFYADWCASCKAFGELLERVEKDRPWAVFAKVNVETATDIAEAHSISGLPSLFCYHEGEVYAKDMGVVPQGRVTSMMPPEPSST